MATKKAIIKKAQDLYDAGTINDNMFIVVMRQAVQKNDVTALFDGKTKEEIKADRRQILKSIQESSDLNTIGVADGTYSKKQIRNLVELKNNYDSLLNLGIDKTELQTLIATW